MNKILKIIAGFGVFAAAVVAMAFPAMAKQSYQSEDGYTLFYDEARNLDETSRYYSVYGWRWEQQEDGAWKLHYKKDAWTPTCDHKHVNVWGFVVSDPREEGCPGEVIHKENYVLGSYHDPISEKDYFLDENGLMVTGSWVSLWKINEVQCLQQWNPEYFKEPERYRKYCAAIYQYYDENGQQLYNTTVDGRQINEDGVWRDPSIVPLREDGTVDLWRLDWDGMHYFSDELKEQYTKEDFYNRLRQFPEYVGETVNPYGAIEMEFSGDISSQEVDALLILLDKDLEDAIWKAHGLDD